MRPPAPATGPRPGYIPRWVRSQRSAYLERYKRRNYYCILRASTNHLKQYWIRWGLLPQPVVLLILPYYLALSIGHRAGVGSLTQTFFTSSLPRRAGEGYIENKSCFEWWRERKHWNQMQWKTETNFPIRQRRRTALASSISCSSIATHRAAAAAHCQVLVHGRYIQIHTHSYVVQQRTVWSYSIWSRYSVVKLHMVST